jgi:hypothetical protein
MLNLFGRSLVERAKSVGIGILASLLVISLWQVSAQNSQTTRGNQLRLVAADVARQFAIALTTYDYDHIDVFLRHVAAVSSPAVEDRVRAAEADVVAARASSLGEATDILVASVTSSGAEAFVSTRQIVSSRYAVGGTELAGLLEVTASAASPDWIVSDYRWLLAPGGSA